MENEINLKEPNGSVLTEPSNGKPDDANLVSPNGSSVADPSNREEADKASKTGDFDSQAPLEGHFQSASLDGGPSLNDDYFGTDYTTESVQMDSYAIRCRAKYDYKLFIALLMGDSLTLPIPDFHITLFSRIVNPEVHQSACAVPRGFAKTTIARLGVCHILTFSTLRNVFYFSHTLDLAIPSVNAIVKFLKSPNYTKVFGEIQWLVEQEGKGIYKFVMPNGKVCHLRARGANQQVRGTNVDNIRIELAICDDIEDREDNENPALFAKLKQWFYGDLKKALDRKFGRIIQIGNIVNTNSLLAEHCESPNWYSIRFSALRSDGEPLWPELWSKEQLKLDYEEYNQQGLASQWFGEMMNVIIPEGSQLVSLSEITFREMPSPGELVSGFLTIDPAISDNPKTAHACVVAVHGFVNDKWQVVDHYSAIATDPIKLYDVAFSLANKWGVSIVGIESEAYQASIKYVFEYIQRREGLGARLEVVQMPTGKRSKYSRIATWVGYLRRGEYTLTRGDIATTNQLLKYDSTKSTNDDDLIDAESYGVYMIEKHLSKIMAVKANSLWTPQAPLINVSPL